MIYMMLRSSNTSMLNIQHHLLAHTKRLLDPLNPGRIRQPQNPMLLRHPHYRPPWPVSHPPKTHHVTCLLG